MNIFYADADKSKHTFITKLFNNNSEHRVKYCTASGKDLIDELKCSMPDVLIMDLILFDYDGFTVLEELKLLNITPNVLLHTCMKDEHLLKNAYDLGIKNVLFKPSHFMQLLEAVENAAEKNNSQKATKKIEISKEEQLRMLSQLISQLGILPNLKGYQYSREAVLLLLNRRSILEGHMKEIYKTIADKYNTKPYCVERNIRNAIEIAWIKGNIQLINDIFGYTVRSEKGKPTNAEFLVMLADKIKLASNLSAPNSSKNFSA